MPGCRPKCCVCCRHTDYHSFKALICGHCVHETCITLWFANSGQENTCPICKRKVYLAEYHPIFFDDIKCDHDACDDDDEPPRGAEGFTFTSSLDDRSYREIVLTRRLAEESAELTAVRRVAGDTSLEVIHLREQVTRIRGSFETQFGVYRAVINEQERLITQLRDNSCKLLVRVSDLEAERIRLGGVEPDPIQPTLELLPPSIFAGPDRPALEALNQNGTDFAAIYGNDSPYAADDVDSSSSDEEPPALEALVSSFARFDAGFVPSTSVWAK